MKKILALLLVVSMVFALAACRNNDGAKKEDAPTGVKMNLETLPTSGIDYVLKTEFYYPENSGITVEYNETDCIALADEGDEYIMMLKIAEDEDYEYTRDWAIESYGEEAIKDVKLGELDAYMYCGIDSYNLCALLEKDAGLVADANDVPLNYFGTVEVFDAPAGDFVVIKSYKSYYMSTAVNTKEFKVTLEGLAKLIEGKRNK